MKAKCSMENAGVVSGAGEAGPVALPTLSNVQFIVRVDSSTSQIPACFYRVVSP